MSLDEFAEYLEASANNYREYRDEQQVDSVEWAYANGSYQAVRFIEHVFSEEVE